MATFADLYGASLDYELGTNDSAVLFTSTRRMASVNEGLREFADLTNCYTRETTVTCSNAVGEYSLMSTGNVPGGDFVRLVADGPSYRYTDASSNVTWVTGDDLPRRDEVWWNAHASGWRASTGAVFPESHYVTQNGGAVALGLYPPPTISTGTAGALVGPYVAQPPLMTADTTVPLTDTGGVTRQDLAPYHQAMVHYAAHKLELLRRDYAASDRQLQKFLGYVQRFIQARRPPGAQTGG